MLNNLADNVEQVAVYNLISEPASFTISRVVNGVYYGFRFDCLNITWSSIVEAQHAAENLACRKVLIVAYSILNKWCGERSEFEKPLNYLTKAEIGRIKPVFEEVATDSWEALRDLESEPDEL